MISIMIINLLQVSITQKLPLFVQNHVFDDALHPGTLYTVSVACMTEYGATSEEIIQEIATGKLKSSILSGL